MRTEDEIRTIIEANVQAVRTKDVGALIPHYAPDVLSFDVIDPLQYKGSASLKSRMEQWFSSFKGDIGYELRELSITSGEDVAFSHSLNHVNGETEKGTLDMWWRATLCYRKINGRWLITHQHNSVPFNPEDGSASLGLKPEAKTVMDVNDEKTLEYAYTSLIQSLLILKLPPKYQIEWCGLGYAPYELVDEFDNWFRIVKQFENQNILDKRQIEALSKLSLLMDNDKFNTPDIFNNLESNEWNEIRKLAKECLVIMNKDQDEVRVAVQYEKIFSENSERWASHSSYIHLDSHDKKNGS